MGFHISRTQRRKAVGRTYAGPTVCFKECNEKAICEKSRLRTRLSMNVRHATALDFLR
jgi:hypothetical protein